jgi:hypothetical protein
VERRADYGRAGQPYGHVHGPSPWQCHD